MSLPVGRLLQQLLPLTLYHPTTVPSKTVAKEFRPHGLAVWSLDRGTGTHSARRRCDDAVGEAVAFAGDVGIGLTVVVVDLEGALACVLILCSVTF